MKWSEVTLSREAIVDLRETTTGYSYAVWDGSSHSIYMTGPDGKHPNNDHSLVPIRTAATNSMVSLGSKSPC